MRHDSDKAGIFHADAVRIGGMILRAVRKDGTLCVEIVSPDKVIFRLDEKRGRPRWTLWTDQRVLRSPKKARVSCTP